MKLIPLTQGQFAKVDDEDFESFSIFKWRAQWDKHTKGFYALRTVCTPSGKISEILHRKIMGDPTGLLVDHRNHDTLDNRKENLRSCNNSQNQMNRGPRTGTASGVKGVSWHKKNKKWTANIQVDGKLRYLGSFAVISDAANAYAESSKKYFGEFGGNYER